MLSKPAGHSSEEPPDAVVKPVKSTKISSNFTSKFRHLVGEPLHKQNNIENIKNLSEALPSESDGGQANDDLVALALSGSGGQVCKITNSRF